MRRCRIRFPRVLSAIVLVLPLAQGCAQFLSLDEFEESSGGETEKDAGGACSLGIDPLTHNFGPVPVGVVSAPVKFTVVNEQQDSIGPLSLFGGDPPNPQFEIVWQDCEGATLVRGQSCSVDFVFAPESVGKHQVPLTVRAGGEDCATAILEGGAPPS